MYHTRLVDVTSIDKLTHPGLSVDVDQYNISYNIIKCLVIRFGIATIDYSNYTSARYLRQ